MKSQNGSEDLNIITEYHSSSVNGEVNQSPSHFRMFPLPGSSIGVTHPAPAVSKLQTKNTLCLSRHQILATSHHCKAFMRRMGSRQGQSLHLLSQRCQDRHQHQQLHGQHPILLLHQFLRLVPSLITNLQLLILSSYSSKTPVHLPSSIYSAMS